MLGRIINLNDQDLRIRGLNGKIYTARGERYSAVAKVGGWVSFVPNSSNKAAINVQLISPDRTFTRLDRICKEWTIEGRDESSRYFYVRPEFEGVTEGQYMLVLGRKGSGKTALGKYIRTHCARAGKARPVEISFEADFNTSVFAMISGLSSQNADALSNFGSYERVDFYKALWEAYVLQKIAARVSGITGDATIKRLLREQGIDPEADEDGVQPGIMRVIQKAFSSIPAAGMKVVGGTIGAVVTGSLLGPGALGGAIAGGAVGEALGEKIGEVLGEEAVKRDETSDTGSRDRLDIFERNNYLRNAIRKALAGSKSTKLPLFVIFDELDYLYNESQGSTYFEIIFALLKLAQSLARAFSIEDSVNDETIRQVIPLVFLRDDVFDALHRSLNITSDMHKWYESALRLDWTAGSLHRLMAFRLWTASQSRHDVRYNEEKTSFDQQWLNYVSEVIPDRDVAVASSGITAQNNADQMGDGGEDAAFEGAFKARGARAKDADQSILLKIYQSSTRVPRDYILAVKTAAASAISLNKRFIDEEAYTHSLSYYSKTFFSQFKGELGRDLKDFEKVFTAIKRAVKARKSEKYRFAYEDFCKILIDAGVTNNDAGAERIAETLYRYSVIANIVGDRYFPTYVPGGEFSPEREILIHKGLWRYLES